MLVRIQLERLKMPTSEKWQEVTYLRVCVTSTNEIRMRQSAIRVQAHREVEPNSSQSTWDVPRPVRFDSDVRKRAYCRSQQIGET